MLNEEFLLDCWRHIRKDAAYGVDEVSAREYEKDLEENIRDLVERLKRGSYRAKLVRMKYIPKGEGKMRPLGIPAILEPDGEVVHPVTGTPQGGIVSPVLANVYLHYVLDLWFQKVVKKHCRGEACLIRYADDFVCAFQYEEDANRFYRVLSKRLGKFGLEISVEKTRVMKFSRYDRPGKDRFDFLGFEFRWGKDRSGKPNVKRRTSRKKLRRSLKNLTQWCKENRHQRLDVLFKKMNAKLRGYYAYYGVIGNYASLQEFFREAVRILFKWLNRCSQRRSYNWKGFQELLELFKIEKPRIVGRPKAR